MEILQFIPGFRSKTKWKMIIATLYYLFTLLSFAGGFWLGIFFLSSPFFVFSLIDVIRYKKNSMSIGRPLIVLLISLALMITSIAAMPPSEQNALQEQNTATQQTQNDQAADQLAQQPDISSQGQDAVTETPSVVPSTSTSQTTNNEQEKESPVPLVAVKVTKVIDGDTFYVKFEDGTEEKVRLIGVDTPESTTQHEPYGEEASNFTKSSLTGKTVYLEKDVSERDKYNRLLRYVWLEKPESINETEIREKMFNAILVAEGYAQIATYAPDVKYADYFKKFQEEARTKEKGLWALEDNKESETVASTSSLSGNKNNAPSNKTSSSGTSTNTQSESKKEITVYVTATGEKYHRAGCRYLKKSKIPISLSEAKASGYEPCKVCNPPR